MTPAFEVLCVCVDHLCKGDGLGRQGVRPLCDSGIDHSGLKVYIDYRREGSGTFAMRALPCQIHLVWTKRMYNFLAPRRDVKKLVNSAQSCERMLVAG